MRKSPAEALAVIQLVDEEISLVRWDAYGPESSIHFDQAHGALAMVTHAIESAAHSEISDANAEWIEKAARHIDGISRSEIRAAGWSNALRDIL